MFCLYYESQWGPKVVLDLFPKAETKKVIKVCNDMTVSK